MTIPQKLTRRAFLGSAAALTSLTIVPRHVVAGSKEPPPSERLNIAGIGAGGRGYAVLSLYGTRHNIASLCDVDEVRGA